MEKIILIETSTALCSVALAEDGAITSYRESSAPKAHASLTAVFIQEMLAERGLTIADCDAVCVSMGPGSYTGLRVGVSTAKGLCFGSGKPLLAVGTLDTLVAQATNVIPGPSNVIPGPSNVIPGLTGDLTPSDKSDVSGDSLVISSETEGRDEKSPTYKFIIPMIDARRMEVYTAVFETAGTPTVTGPSTVIPGTPTVIPGQTGDLTPTNVIPGPTGDPPRQLTETAPAIIDENSFAEYLEQGPCLFIGDGAGKCADVIKHPNAQFCQCWPKASSMLAPALAAYRAGDFKDVAYFEPFYLKEFVATVSKKKLF